MAELTFNELPKAVTQLCDKLNNIERLLVERGNSSRPESDQLLTIQQAAQLLNLSVPTLYGKVHNAEIPVCKQGKRLYFSKQELTEWVKSGRRKTTSEIEAEAKNHQRKR